jgi:hypothetical protein
MSSLTPSRSLLLLVIGLLGAGCEPRSGSDGVRQAPGVKAAPAASASASSPKPPPAAQAAPAVAGSTESDLARIVTAKSDIEVNGEPACALTVRYDGSEEQPVTWAGEKCGQILVRLSTLEDLKRIGQHGKLSEESLDDLARMPGRRAVYIEGGHSSAIYPANVMGRVYEVPLAD